MASRGLTASSDVAVSAPGLGLWMSDVLSRVGVPAADAAAVADNLLEANLKGIDSHGVVRLPAYIARLRERGTNASAAPRIVFDGGAFCVLDGDNGLGAVVGTEATRMAIERARAYGCGFVAVRNSSHFGAAGYYAERAARAGMFAVVFSNAEATMAPAGGREALFGTNPMALAFPASPEGPIVYDIATSAGAQGKIISAAQQGQAIPLGWAIDADGEPTTDPARALKGLLLPFGGHKGAGLAFMIDLICGVLPDGMTGTEMTGMYRDPDKPQRVGHLIGCIDLGKLDLDQIRRRAGTKARRYAATLAGPGANGMYWPGQRSAQCRALREQHGVPLSSSLVGELLALGRSVDVPFDLAARSAGDGGTTSDGGTTG